MKIVITDADTVFDSNVTADVFAQYGELVCYPLTSPQELSARIQDADIVLCNKTYFGKQEMDAAKNLKYIGLFATGFNNVDTDYARQKGITVCNAPGYSTEAVAQHTFALLLQIFNRVGDYDRIVAQGEWKTSPTFSMFPFPLYELSGRTLGIVGYGSIGRRVAEIAKAFRMRVLVHNRSRVSDGTVTQVPFDTLLRESDVISLHCPLNADSEKLMNADAFSRMKQGAVLINTSRGPVVDEEALRDALLSGKLLAAGIDVLCREPMREDCPLFGIDNCCITPHVAWAGLETRMRLISVVAENLKAFLSGSPINVVS